MLTAGDVVDGVPEAKVGVALARGHEHEENDEEEPNIQGDETERGKSLERSVPFCGEGKKRHNFMNAAVGTSNIAVSVSELLYFQSSCIPVP